MKTEAGTVERDHQKMYSTCCNLDDQLEKMHRKGCQNLIKKTDEINTISNQIGQPSASVNYRTGYNMDTSNITDKNYLKILEG